MDFEKFDKTVGESLDENKIAVAADHFRVLEEEVIVEMVASIKGGWRTEKEAFDAYMEWKAKYSIIGQSAVQ